jgi:hypothetical protein
MLIPLLTVARHRPSASLPASLPLEGRLEPPLRIVAFRSEDDDKGEDLGACEDSNDGDPKPAVRCEEKSDSKSQQRKLGQEESEEIPLRQPIHIPPIGPPPPSRKRPAPFPR